MQPQNISIENMFLNADPVVQGVMLLLFLASLLCWIIIIEKTILLRKAKAQIKAFRQAAVDAEHIGQGFAANCPGFTAFVVETGLRESKDDAGHETRRAYRERMERAMAGVLNRRMDFLGRRTLFLATVGSTSPFIGLLGTVWGIMHSFIGIASSGETSLAVVAPGIAEALFATAIGLVAAIPAVVAFNKIASSLKALTREGLAAISLLGNSLARQHFIVMERDAHAKN